MVALLFMAMPRARFPAANWRRRLTTVYSVVCSSHPYPEFNRNEMERGRDISGTRLLREWGGEPHGAERSFGDRLSRRSGQQPRTQGVAVLARSGAVGNGSLK